MALQQRLPKKTMTVDDQGIAALLLELGRLGHDIAFDMDELVQSAFCKVFEKTYLRMLLILAPYSPV